MIYQRSFWLCIFCSLLMVGCKQGCTFTSVVKQKAKTAQVGNQKMEIIASLLKSRNIKITKGDHKIKASDSWYTVDIEVQADTQRINPSWYFPETDEAKLQDYLDKVELKSNKKGTYFTLQYAGDKEKVELYQRFGQLWMESPYFDDLQKGKFNLESLPVEAAFIDQLIFDEALCKNAISVHKTYIEWYFAQQQLSERQAIGLLNCLETEQRSLAKAWLVEKNMKKQSAGSAKFKEAALDYAVKNITENQGSIRYESDVAANILLSLGAEKEFAKCDDVIIKTWQDASNDDFDEYIKHRLTDTKHPIPANKLAKLIQNCKQAIDKTIQGDENYSEYNFKTNYVRPENAMNLMFWKGDKAYQTKIVDYYLSNSNKIREYDRDAVFTKHFNEMDASLRSKVTAFAKNEFDRTVNEEDPFKAADWYNFLDGKIACPELKGMFNKYVEKGKSDVFLKKKKPDC